MIVGVMKVVYYIVETLFICSRIKKGEGQREEKMSH